MWKPKKSQDMLSSFGSPTNQAVGQRGKKSGRESQLDIKTVRKGEEKDNSPKERENPKIPIPHEEVEEIPFKPAVKEPTFRIGTREFEDVFAWGPEDMLGVDPEAAMHRLHVDSMFVPIKQRKRTFSDEKNMAIKTEVEALLKVRSIRELQFPEWIANVVLVKKANISGGCAHTLQV
ncbi:hypothetical protein LIER_14738 [Lithospermum erythrorhizon]|uniref:Uncharacterized protein n=1 Tax=Lithospermum erythrorhizon TaxID=34254 RepID=A0AAV3Q0M0_LITER